MNKYISTSAILRIGLACVFLANSLTAFLDPSEFQDLISGSFAAGFLPISVATAVVCVGVHDLLIAVLLVIGWKTRFVAMYATLWITAVVFAIGVISLDALEHLGFIAVTLTLAFQKD